MFGVVILLDGAATVGFGDGSLHTLGEVVGIHNHVAFNVAGGAADGLDEGALGTQEAFFVGIQNGD